MPGPVTRWAVSSTSAARVASSCETRPLSPTAVRWSTTRTRGWSRRNARISPGTSHDPRLSGKASVTTPASGSTSSLDRRQPVVEVVDERVDVPLERRAGVRHPQHPAGAPQQRGADLLLEPGQGPRDAGLAHAEDLAHLRHGVAVGDQLEPAQRIGVHPMTIAHGLYVPISLDAWTPDRAHWTHEHLNPVDHRQGRAPRAS